MEAPKRTQSELEKYLQYGIHNQPDNPIDETSLNDQELQDRLGAFKELGQTTGSVDLAGANREFKRQLDAFGVGGSRDVIENVLSNFLTKANRLPDLGEFRDEVNAVSPGLGQGLLGVGPMVNFLTNGENSNHFANFAMDQVSAPNVKADIKRIQDMQGVRAKKAGAQGDLDAFVNKLPQDLASNTDQQYTSQLEQGKHTLEDFLNPQVRGQLAARGLLTSGDLDAELASGAGEIMNPIQQQYAQNKADDLAFFENAAYQTNLKKTIDANQNLSGQLDFERGNALNAQSQRFQQGQNNISDSASMALFRRQQQANLQAQQERLRRQSDLQSAQNRSGMIGGIGQSIGSIGGAVVGNMIAPGVGGMVGAGIGGQFGGATSNLFSKT